MAYNSYFPVTYQPNFFGNQGPYYPQPQMMQPPQQAPQQPTQRVQQPVIQQSGFVLVQSEQEARAYPVAPGNSITFKDESLPYCYVKTMGFNQLDRPVFERYRLVKEDSPAEATHAPVETVGVVGDKDAAYALKTDVEALWAAVDDLRAKMPEKKPIKARKIEADDDDDE